MFDLSWCTISYSLVLPFSFSDTPNLHFNARQSGSQYRFRPFRNRTYHAFPAGGAQELRNKAGVHRPATGVHSCGADELTEWAGQAVHFPPDQQLGLLLSSGAAILFADTNGPRKPLLHPWVWFPEPILLESKNGNSATSTLTLVHSCSRGTCQGFVCTVIRTCTHSFLVYTAMRKRTILWRNI